MSGGRGGWLRAVVVLGAVVALVALRGSAVGAAMARPHSTTGPSVTSFAASPPALFGTGGTATLSAEVTNATSCTFSSKKPVTGLPASIPCSSGAVSEGISVPANTTQKPAIYKFAIVVSGSKKVKATATLTVDPAYCSNIEPDADLQKCDLSDADLSSAELSGATLFEDDLSGTTLVDANLTDVDMPLANLSGAIAGGAIFVNANLADAKLPGADLTDADMSGARLTDTHLTGANLTGSDLQYVDLDGATLDQANLTQADLDNAYLTNVGLIGAVWDDTTCPDGSNSDDHGGTCANNLG